MAERRDYYAVLGVARGADAAELKRAYRELAMRYHPDQNPGDSSAEARFKEVSEAYTVLSNPAQRLQYDQGGFAGGPSLEDLGLGVDLSAFKALFESLFGDLLGRSRTETGRDLRYTLELSFEEAALGTRRTIRFKSRADCTSCDGTGARGRAAGLQPCSGCGGRGEVKVQQGLFNLSKSCPSCRGTGQRVRDACPRCRGDGTVEVEREFEVAIPPGTEDGTAQRVAGQGEAGRRGGSPGDLHVIVRVLPHPLFRQEGEVLTYDLPISVVEAALGATVRAPTLDGPVELKIPAGAQSGALLRLRGRGRVRTGAPRGDLHVRLLVETPTQLTPRQQALLSELGALLGREQGPAQAAFAARLASTPKTAPR